MHTKLLLTLTLLVLPLSSCTLYQYWQTQSTSVPNSEIWQVVRVSDGDTIVVTNNQREERIRLCGIDAPEIAHDGNPGQPLGDASKAYLQHLINQGNGQVAIVPIERDRYGRIVAEVFTPDPERFLQQDLLTAGMAYVYPQYIDSCPNAQAMQQAEAIAQQQHLGVWNNNHQRPWDYRQSH